MKFEVFESIMCCPTGVCGSEPDMEHIKLQNVIQALSKASNGFKLDN